MNNELSEVKRVKGVKVVRTCPRCRVRAYHWGNDMGIQHRICCARCGHCWTGRILKDECSMQEREHD